MSSPFQARPADQWLRITQRLVKAHPLSLEDIGAAALAAWDLLWCTRVGSGQEAIPLAEIDPPATVVAYLFEKLLAATLAEHFPGQWRGARSKDEKDLVYIPDSRMSIEVKGSGQAGTRVFGNRSYGQKVQDARRARKDKSGYYILFNFSKQTLFLLRFGWIDVSDWKPQDAPTGQMAGLQDAVYERKMVVVPGDYRLQAPVRCLSSSAAFAKLGIATIGDLIRYPGELPRHLESVRATAQRLAL